MEKAEFVVQIKLYRVCKEELGLESIQLVFGLVCEDVRFEINGRISIIGEGNLFFLPQLPFTLPLCLLTKWVGSPGTKARVSLRMVNPDSAIPVIMCEQDLELSASDEPLSFGGTVHKLPWQVQTTGIHQIEILIDGEPKGCIELVIKKKGPMQ